MGTLWCLLKLVRVLGGFFCGPSEARGVKVLLLAFFLARWFLCFIKKRRGCPGHPGLGVFVLRLEVRREAPFASPPAWHFVCVSLSVTECFYNKIRPGLFIAASQVSVNMFSDRRHPLKYASCKQALLPSPLLENERIEK